jgi:hypothetical protein
MIYQDADGNIGIGVVILNENSIFPTETITANLTAGINETITFSLGKEAKVIQMYDSTGEQVTPELFRPNGVDSLVVRVSVTGVYEINVIAWD